MKVASSTKTTVTVTLTRKEARELSRIAFGEVAYFADAIYFDRDGQKQEWRNLRAWWLRRSEQLQGASEEPTP